MKERPILFSTEMITAILEGRKTQTRRIIKPQPTIDNHPQKQDVKIATIGSKQYWLNSQETHPNHIINACKHRVGDHLWIKETFFILEPEHCEGMKNRIVYKNNWHESNEEWRKESIEKGYSQYKWTSALFMSKIYSRIQLEIINLKVDRLQNITEEDAIKEGIQKHFETTSNSVCYLAKGKRYITAKRAFQALWESINGEDSWNLNPFVWVIEFKKVTQ